MHVLQHSDEGLDAVRIVETAKRKSGHGYGKQHTSWTIASMEWPRVWYDTLEELEAALWEHRPLLVQKRIAEEADGE